MASISMYEVLRFGYENEMWPKKHLFEFIIWSELRLTHSFTLFCGLWWENFGNRHNLFIVTTKHGCIIGVRGLRNKQEIQFIKKNSSLLFLCSFSLLSVCRPNRWCRCWCCFCWTSIKSNFRFLLPKMLYYSIALAKQMKCKHI